MADSECPAVGGTLFKNGSNCIYTFNNNGTLNFTSAINVSVLIVAGGGGGASGGAGAGGLIYNSSYLADGNITIVVGLGGTPVQGCALPSGGKGGNSSFGTLVANGGGGGGYAADAAAGGNGGSGGGGGSSAQAQSAFGLGTTGQGHNGGDNSNQRASPYPSGGGGGAGAAGQNATGASASGNGGNGLSYDINGSSVYYAGGGGGSLYAGTGTAGSGGLGGGGAGILNANGTAGTDGLGGGGGGTYCNAATYGGYGGKGVVVVSYPYAADTIPPSLIINNPLKYQNFSLNVSINLNYSVSDALNSISSVWYNLDNGTNVTIYSYSTQYVNQTDGFSTSAFGSGSPFGITTNGSDFWIADAGDYFVYHTNRTGGNMTDGFSTLAFGSNAPYTITTNGSDFWIADTTDDFVYHTNRTGGNMTDGFSLSAIGSSDVYGITTNGSDFWITDITDDFVYHTNRTGGNMTDGFSTSAFGSTYPYGITTNITLGTPTDFWINDVFSDFVYHTNRTGGNITDGFSTLTFGSDTSHSITTNGSDFWITDTTDDFVYHVTLSITPPSNSTFNASEGNHILYIYANDSVGNINDSEYVVFTIDLSNPSIQIAYPTNNTNSSDTNLDINYTYSDLTPSSCWYSNDSYLVNTSLSNCNNLTSIVWSSGQHNITIWINDSVGHENSSSVSFTIDVTTPYFTFIPDNVSINYTQGFGVDFNATDEIDFGTFAINWTTLFSINSSGWFTNSTPNIAVGNYYINVTINDTSNNLNSTIYLVNISKATGLIYLYINNLRANYSGVEDSSNQNIWLNSTLITGIGNIELWLNGTIYNNGTSPLSNLTNLSIGSYNVTAKYSGNTNYTSDDEVWNVTILAKPSVTTIQGSGSIGGGSGVIMVGNISFYNMILTYNTTWNFEIVNEIKIETLNFNNKLVNVDNLNVTLVNPVNQDIKYSSSNSKESNGTYVYRYFINKQNINNLDFVIVATKDNYNIVKVATISMKLDTSINSIKNEIRNNIFKILNFIDTHLMVIIIVTGISFLIVLFIVMSISIIKKNKRNVYKH